MCICVFNRYTISRHVDPFSLTYNAYLFQCLAYIPATVVWTYPGKSLLVRYVILKPVQLSVVDFKVEIWEWSSSIPSLNHNFLNILLSGRELTVKIY